MENSYSISVTNRYELFLLNDADPLKALKTQEQEKELKKKSKVAEKETKGKGDVVPNDKLTVKTQGKTIIETPNHKPQDIIRDDNKAGLKLNTYLKDNNKSADNQEERNNKREQEFDQQTVSYKPYGISGFNKPVDKLEGGGEPNWGFHNDIEEVKKNEIDLNWREMGDSVSAHENVPKRLSETNEAMPEGSDALIVREELKQFTFDEWKAQKVDRQKPQYNLRKAGEGVDPRQWKKMYELSKKKVVLEDSDGEEYDASVYPQRVGRQKYILDIYIHFNDTRGGGIGRRGRGRGRSGPRGQQGSNQEQSGPRLFRDAVSRGATELPITEEGDEHHQEDGRQNTPKVDDEHDFPSLC